MRKEKYVSGSDVRTNVESEVLRSLETDNSVNIFTQTLGLVPPMTMRDVGHCETRVH